MGLGINLIRFLSLAVGLDLISALTDIDDIRGYLVINRTT